MKKHSKKFLLGFSLAISLSGCAGVNYGNYPTPNAQACFINPTTVNAKQQGLRNLAFQKAKQGIPVKTLVADDLIPATNQLIVNNNPQPLNALYAQIKPQTLANFMIGCNQVMVQETNQMIRERNQMIKEISASQHYLNTTPAPQPTYIPTKPQATGTCSSQYFYTHPETNKASDAFDYIYTMNPLVHINALIFGQPLTLASVKNMKINAAYTERELEKIHQQLQQIHQQLQVIKMGKTSNTSPQKILNQVMAAYQIIPPSERSIVRPAFSVMINYQKAVIAAQNGNFMPLIAIYSQVQPSTWRNYFVGCYQLAQKDHATAQVCNTAKACKPKP